MDGFGEAADRVGRDGIGSGGIRVVSSGRDQSDDGLQVEEDRGTSDSQNYVHPKLVRLRVTEQVRSHWYGINNL